MIFSAISYLAIALYLLASIFQVRNLSVEKNSNFPVKFLASLAIFCHLFIVFQTVFDSSGYNFGLYSMLSLMALSIGVIVLLGSFRRPIANLFLLIFPIGAITVLLNALFKNHSELKIDIDRGMGVHIAMSVLAYSILTIAAIQAAMLSFGDKMLRSRQLSLIKGLPALETMEQLMFELPYSEQVRFLHQLYQPSFVSNEVEAWKSNYKCSERVAGISNLPIRNIVFIGNFITSRKK